MPSLKGNNVNRAKWANVAFTAFVEAVDNMRINDTATNLQDLLADFMHFAEKFGLDIDLIWERAQEDYIYEREHPHE